MTVEFTEIVLAFDFVSSGRPYEHQAFLNTETGKIYWQSAFGDNEEELPSDIDGEKYVEIPHKNDLGLGKPIALDFTYRRTLGILHLGKGGYRNQSHQFCQLLMG